jgi:hypothetical protein
VLLYATAAAESVDDLAGKIIYMYADNGGRIGHDPYCVPVGYGPKGSLATAAPCMTIGSTKKNIWDRFRVIKQGPNQIALKVIDENFLYVSRCNGCVMGTSITDFAVAMIRGEPLPPVAIWNVTFDSWNPQFFFTLQADNGKFMKRCHNCASWGAWPIPDMLVVTGSAGERPAQIMYVTQPSST